MMTPPMVGPEALIRSKTRVPAVAEAVVERGRVVGELTRAAEGRRILQVVASAGSGKTTAVVQFLLSRPGPRAWLTLGEADGSPGRFVSYLAAAVEPILPGSAERTHELLAGGVRPADCAALLVEALPDGACLVIDDLHLVEDRPPVLAVLRALVDAVAPGALVVLVSRRMVHLDLSRAQLTGRAGTVSGRELAFTEDEVGELLEARGVEASAAEVTASSGGWAAGIVFDALNGARDTGGGADDPFFDYLGAEVLAALPPDLRRSVVRSAVLHTVDPRGLAALLDIPSGDALYGAIRRQQLPATLEPEGLRYHPRFREFLLSLLREDPAEMRLLLARHARRLRADGHAEEAADHLIAAGLIDEAADAVAEVGVRLLLRGDWEKVLVWCDALGEEAIAHRPALRGAQLQATQYGRRNEMPAMVRGLIASGEYDRLMAEAPDAATTAVFGLHLAGDWGSLLDVLPPDDASQSVRAMRYVLTVGSGSAPPRPWPVAEVRGGVPHVGLLQCGLYFQGRHDEVEEFARLVVSPSSLIRRVGTVYRVASLRERGMLAEARALFDAAQPYLPVTGFDDFWRHFEGELVFAEGDRERGLRYVREARLSARERAHQPADRAIFASTEGKMLVRLGRYEEAAEVLRTSLAWSTAHGLPAFGEWAATWLAAAMLRTEGDAAEAAALLERTLAGMEAADRRLEMPAAWVLLAEARWRLGDEAGHDAAADAARETARRIGTLGPLVAALADAPDVLARRIDAGGPEQEDWRALARAPMPATAPATLDGARVVIGTLGRPRVVVDGEERDISPPRAIDVAAAVARAGARGVPRASLVAGLAAHSAEPANYLRQVIHRLRRLVPDGVELTSEDGLLRWAPRGAVVTEDQALWSLLSRARQEVGAARVPALEEALAMAARGPLVAAVEDDALAVAEMRDELAGAVADARRDHGALLLEAGRSAEAEAVARTAVAAEPYREDGWRLLMRAAAAAAGGPAAVPVYVECCRVLGEIGLEPSQETRALLERLRTSRAGVVSARG